MITAADLFFRTVGLNEVVVGAVAVELDRRLLRLRLLKSLPLFRRRLRRRRLIQRRVRRRRRRFCRRGNAWKESNHENRGMPK